VLLETKGTLSASRTTLNSDTETGYRNQVEPHLGSLFGGSVVTHGYAVGSWMDTGYDAELYVHHTDPVTVTSSAPAGSGSAPSATVAAGHFANVFRLLRIPLLVTALENRQELSDEILFVEFPWQGMLFLADGSSSALSPIVRPSGVPGFGLFALQRDSVEAILRWLSLGEIERPQRIQLPKFDLGIQLDVQPSREGALFSDGLAWIEIPNTELKGTQVRWLSKERTLK
jgi:hypothetical protein